MITKTERIGGVGRGVLQWAGLLLLQRILRTTSYESVQISILWGHLLYGVFIQFCQLLIFFIPTVFRLVWSTICFCALTHDSKPIFDVRPMTATQLWSMINTDAVSLMQHSLIRLQSNRLHCQLRSNAVANADGGRHAWMRMWWTM